MQLRVRWTDEKQKNADVQISAQYLVKSKKKEKASS